MLRAQVAELMKLVEVLQEEIRLLRNGKNSGTSLPIAIGTPPSHQIGRLIQKAFGRKQAVKRAVPKLIASLMLCIRGGFSCYRIRSEVIKNSEMEERKVYTKNKGGRPVKAVKRSKLIGVRCCITEQFLIEAKAKAARLTKSEFLRILGLTGKIDIRKKTLPTEVLIAIANLNHLAANMNQIAKKRNSSDELNAIDRAKIQVAVGKKKQFVATFKNHFQ